MPKILVIEDDKSLCDKIAFLLRKNAYEYTTANTGKDGIAKIKTEDPDLIICDIMLPDIDGYKILHDLKKEEETTNIPFIFLTAKAEMSDLRRGMNLGADDYLPKPFKIDDLLQSIKLRLKNREQLQAISAFTISQEVMQREFQPDDLIFFDSGEVLKSMLIKDIICILAEGNYTNIFSLDKKKYLVRKLLKDWVVVLPKNNFLRIHRSALINLNHISGIEKWHNSTFRVHLLNFDRSIAVSRQFSAELKRKILH